VVLAVFSEPALSSRLRLLKANEDSSDFKLRMDNFNNVQYSAPLSVGSQTMPVIYDTGSFEILVLSTMCKTCSRDHDFYDSRKSATFLTAEGVTAEHLFGSGPVLIEKGYEMVRVGRTESPYVVQKMPFWQVIDHGIAVWNQNAHFSGIVGLGHPSRIPEGFSAEPVSDETLLSKMGVQQFAICLQRSARAVAPGWLMMGPSIGSLASESSAFRTVPVIGKVHWGVQLTKVRLEGGGPTMPVQGDPCIPSCGAIIDSGTSLIAVPPSAVGLTDHLSHMIRRDCSNLHMLPSLRMNIGGHDIELPPAAYVMKGYGGCKPGFMGIDKQSQFGPVWILGMPFLRYYFSIFDRASLSIHIAESTPACHMPAANMTLRGSVPNPATLVNTTSGQGSGVGRSRAFAADDFQPTPVDLNATRIPGWAKEGYRSIDL
jgi:hypothetical protein